MQKILDWSQLKKALFIALQLFVVAGCANQELLNAQPQRVLDNTEAVLASEKDRANFYYVGFAADYTLDVFSNEVLLAQDLFDDNFGTKGRSVVLLNNDATIDSIPMATPQNLDSTLSQVAQKMDLSNDILVLFISGHGGYERGVKVNFWPHHSSWVEPSFLSKSLKTHGFKWKIIVVSSCFSGQFVAPLIDSKTMVITASRPERPSFGCTSSDEFTYFGEAYFKHSLPKTSSFKNAYMSAKEEISKRENAMGYPNSMPMFRSGVVIDAKLLKLQNEN